MQRACARDPCDLVLDARDVHTGSLAAGAATRCTRERAHEQGRQQQLVTSTQSARAAAATCDIHTVSEGGSSNL